MNDEFRLVDSRWDDVLDTALQLGLSKLRIVCPFIKNSIAVRLLERGNAKDIHVITRFNLADFCDGVSDTSALRCLLNGGAQIRGVKNLHAKLYLFGTKRAILTSANLTSAALRRNHEFGFVADNEKIVDSCINYFDALWGRAGQNLTIERLVKWEETLTEHLSRGSRPSSRFGLGDEGADAGETDPPIDIPSRVDEAPQAFVKFFGVSSDRADKSLAILEEIKRAGCHWACTYPKGKRPRQVKDGAIIYLARLVKDPNDIIIFGRAVAMKYV